MKVLGKGLLLVLIFVGGWLLLSQINFREWWGIDKASENSEERISEFIKENLERTEDIIKDKKVTQKLDSLLERITDRNNLNRNEIKLIILNKPEVNAFALPTDYLVVNSGLIQACESPEALSGVLAHELGHIQLNHVRKKLIKELGLAVLISSTSGGGGEVVRQVTQTLSSTAYDRSLEEEADEKAISYLLEANIDPEPLAEFFYLLSMKEPDFMPDLAWLSTHPTSEDRAKEIMRLISSADKASFTEALSESSWKELQQLLSDKDTDNY